MEYVVENISDVEDIEFPHGTPVKLKYSSEEFDYNLLIINKAGFENVIVLSNGAVDLEKKTPPIFMRTKWAKEIEGKLIYLDDPTIHETSLSLGWGQGNKNEYVLKVYSEIVKKISEKLNVFDQDICYYGSSAGGFMSLILSSMHNDSIAIVNNPQTDIKNYHETHSKPLLELSYGSIEDAYSKYKERVNIVMAFKYFNNVPPIFYIQNQFSHHDLKFHVNPFIKAMKEEALEINNVTFINYFDKEKGHTPMDKNQTLKSLNLLVKRGIL